MGRRPSTICVTLAALMREPGTCPEIAARLGNRRRDHVGKQFRALRAEGVIYVQSWRRAGGCGPFCPVWALQSVPFAQPDAPKPAPKPAYVPKRKPKQMEPDMPARIVIDAARGVTRHHCL